MCDIVEVRSCIRDIPLLVPSPPSSPSPPLAQLHHSSLWEPGNYSKKYRAVPYSSTKWHQQCCPSSVAKKGKLEAMKMFQKLQKVLGLGMAMEVFQKVLAAVEEDM